MNYTITLRIGHVTKTIFTKAPIGDLRSLAQHAQEILYDGKIEDAAREIIFQLCAQVSDSTHDLHGICDTCGGPLGEDFHTINTECLAGVVMCNECLGK